MPRRVDKVKGKWGESRYAMGAAYRGEKVTRPKKAVGRDFDKETTDTRGRKRIVHIEVKTGNSKLSRAQQNMKATKDGKYKVVRYKNMMQ